MIRAKIAIAMAMAGALVGPATVQAANTTLAAPAAYAKLGPSAPGPPCPAKDIGPITYTSNGHTLKAVLHRDTKGAWTLPCIFRWTVEMWLDTNPPDPPKIELFADYLKLEVWKNNTVTRYTGYGPCYSCAKTSDWFTFGTTDTCQADNSGTKLYDYFTFTLFHNAYVQDPSPFNGGSCK